MKTGLLATMALLSCCCMYSQQKAPPTEEELQTMIKKIQKPAKAKFKAGMGFESGQKLKFKEGISLRASINSGVSFEPGRLKNLWDKIKPPPEVPINKNVKFYKPNSQ